MPKSICFYCLILFASIKVIGQSGEPEIKFGKINQWEIDLKAYENDPSASAVVLFDKGENIFDPKRFVYKRHTRIKIFRKDGYRFSDQIFHIRKTQAVKNFKAVTYNYEGGKIVESILNEDGRYEEDFNDYFDIVRFVLPNVREGSIVEFSYEIDGSGLYDWQFQREIPVIWSEYILRVIKQVEFHKLFTGYLTPHIYEEEMGPCGQNMCRTIRTVMTDVPALTPEPFMSSSENYASKLSVQIASIKTWRDFDILSDWDALAFRYHEKQFFADNVKNSNFLRSISQALVSGKTHPDQKVLAIYNYVKGHMEWNNRYSKYCYDNLKEAHQRGTGTSGEINLMLLSMLRYAGLPADPVLICTKSNGIIRQELPSDSQFNNVLVLTDLNSQKFLLDATDKHLSFDFIPESCLNGYGYIAVRQQSGWVELRNLTKTKIVIKCALEFESENTASGKISVVKSGYEAQAVRAGIAVNGHEKYWEDQFTKTNIKHVESSVSRSGDQNEFLVEDHIVAIPNLAGGTGDVIYFNPMIMGRITENPFKNNERKYPIDFSYPKETSYMAKFKIPEGYDVEELPDQKLAILPDNSGRFTYNASVSDREITIVSQMVLNRSLFSTEEYLDLREFFKVVSSKQAEQIILVKTSEN